MIFLPVVVFLRDFGIDCGWLDDMIPAGDPTLEIPTMSTDEDEERGNDSDSEEDAPPTYGSMEVDAV